VLTLNSPEMDCRVCRRLSLPLSTSFEEKLEPVLAQLLILLTIIALTKSCLTIFVLSATFEMAYRQNEATGHGVLRVQLAEVWALLQHALLPFPISIPYVRSAVMLQVLCTCLQAKLKSTSERRAFGYIQRVDKPRVRATYSLVWFASRSLAAFRTSWTA
jgi:hypothetical protein